ncbi:hypothetical protein DQ238_06830 [Geodermatophilus sp. TF02-6]|uniref:hypothetical protein n=1 Tax=Geodermatophilus sp. TF02-6 TaxID=2250575 RepID=UPI000DEB3D92|nr:hypothetical protein [Geodermatophilus sp. TF02-6]RBY81725.1 hypothetical protein DQ238_06830 [Geodermatophilus sp. TF02-6]
MHSPGAVIGRLRPLLLAVHQALSAGVAVSAAVHAAHGWNPTADRHLDHQLVRREAMERLKPWGARPEDDELSDPLQTRQLEFADTSTDNLGLAMSGLLLRTPSDVLRVWRSDDGELPAAATDGLRAFYRQDPSRQLQLDLDPDDDPEDPDDDPDRFRPAPGHLALLWADADAVLTRLDLVRPCGHVGRRVLVDWHVDLFQRLLRPAARPPRAASGTPTAGPA